MAILSKGDRSCSYEARDASVHTKQGAQQFILSKGRSRCSYFTRGAAVHTKQGTQQLFILSKGRSRSYYKQGAQQFILINGPSSCSYSITGNRNQFSRHTMSAGGTNDQGWWRPMLCMLSGRKKSHVVESSTWPLNSHNCSEKYTKT